MTRFPVVVLMVVLSAAVHAAGLAYTAPAGWKPVATSSSMRVAQFALPHAAGDSEDAELVVYYFGGSVRTVEANIERWVGQMQQPDGRPSSAVPQRQSRTINGLKVTLVDVPGTYRGRDDAGLGAAPQQPELQPARGRDRNGRRRPVLHQAHRAGEDGRRVRQAVRSRFSRASEFTP